MNALFLRHLYAVFAIFLVALYAPHWVFPTVIAVVYTVDLLTSFLSSRTASQPSRSPSTPVSATLATAPGASVDDTLVDSSPPPSSSVPTADETLDNTFDEHGEQLPIHDVRHIQEALNLPPDAEITVEDNTDNPWNRALQQLRAQQAEGGFDADQTLAYGPDFDPGALSADGRTSSADSQE